MRVIKTAIAREDIVSIGIYFEKQSTGLTNKFLTSFTETLKVIKIFPDIGYAYKGIEVCELRVLQIKNFKRLLIFYKVSEKEILIVRVIHASRNIPHLLEELVG